MAPKSQKQAHGTLTTEPTFVVKQTKSQTAPLTANEQATSVKQSLELVQTVVHASISTLLYLRQLFDEKCFDKQRYIISNNHTSYRDYAEGKNAIPLQPGDVPGKYLQIMRRNRSSRLNHLIDWLEHGAFRSLQDGTLRALQLSIMENPDESDKVLELFTFTFDDKHTNDGLDKEGPIFQLGSINSSRITNRNVASKIQSFVQQIVSLDYFAPRLPELVGIQFHLFLNEECAPGFEAPGFTPSENLFVLFPDVEDGVKSYHVPQVDAGFHQISLHCTHRSQSDDRDGSLTPFPGQFAYRISHDRCQYVHLEAEKQDLDLPTDHAQRNAKVTEEPVQDTPMEDSSSTASESIEPEALVYREKLQQMVCVPLLDETRL
ncbi:hypothetical protein BU24DRAFT_2563 [Aaosphaeria arxii CBS 175.79]|uniref:HORMA domain-containing protein n=1 Tax=Aaosphaeria arxii CBS 175.79 TaxID=1450172 RepID=A0A6A5Y7L0_9PLEO|nr:uncharacterized protein BU24DRAFT_2563 [Aaosphaeria arxii CBS 175.79]KAF2020534.1 hypothetical protein BU24DRAFT_2563 [Aaosphaeria arxii CBS 175.79]